MSRQPLPSYTKYQQWKNEPISTTPYLTIVIPAYNEAHRIVPTIGAIASYISAYDFPWELLVADDGSTDETVAILENLGMANLQVLVTQQNGGKGSAVQRGMLAARGKYILFADADNSTPIEELGHLLERAESGWDVVVGSRAVQGAQAQNRTYVRRAMSSGLRGLVRYLGDIGVRDTQCGFKLFRREAAQQIFARQTIMGFSFDLEILYLAQKLGYKIGEEPVAWFDAPGSKVNATRETYRFLRDLLKIKVNNLTGVYKATSPFLRTSYPPLPVPHVSGQV